MRKEDMEIDGIKVGFRRPEMSAPEVVAYLTDMLQERKTVMIHRDSRGRHSKGHLRLYQDGKGFFVKIGQRGRDKAYLTGCEITLLDGTPTLWQFWR